MTKKKFKDSTKLKKLLSGIVEIITNFSSVIGELMTVQKDFIAIKESKYAHVYIPLSGIELVTVRNRGGIYTRLNYSSRLKDQLKKSIGSVVEIATSNTIVEGSLVKVGDNIELTETVTAYERATQLVYIPMDSINFVRVKGNQEN